MIASALSLGILLAALRVTVLAAGHYLRAEQEALLHDQAAYAFELLNTALQQAGHVDASRAMPAIPSRPLQGAVTGLDNVSLPGGTPLLEGASQGGSDVLAIHFAGDALGRVHNCAGMPVPEADTLSDDRGWSIFHVAVDTKGEPELRCKYRSDAGWVSQAIATGVTSFQVLYGLDHDADGLPNDFVSASRLHALDAASARKISLWTRVVAVHIALLQRSAHTVHGLPAQRAIALFGAAYANAHGADDPGSLLPAERLRADRLYQQFDTVVFLANGLRPDQ